MIQVDVELCRGGDGNHRRLFLCAVTCHETVPDAKKSCGYNEGMECDPAMKNERCLVLIQEGVQ